MRQPLVLHNAGDQIGRYVIRQIVGYGNFGAVYEAANGNSAVTSIALKQAFDPNAIRSFQGEFAALHGLSHANLARYIEIFEANGDGYLVMEFAPGQSLENVIQSRQEPLPEQQVLGYAVQLCDVLNYLHIQPTPIFHRDIKPANIRLTADGLIKLVDFGLLKQGMMSTRTSRRALTPAYAPIEQWGSGQGTNAQSDIYSLGATLYHLLTGQEPPVATDRFNQAADPLVAPHRLVPSISTHVSEAITNAMALAQRDRFTDAATFKRALAGHISAKLPTPGGVLGSIVGSLTSRSLPPISPDSHPAPASAVPQRTKATSTTMRVPSAKPELIAILPHEGNHGRPSSMRDITYSPDSQILATSTMEGTVRLWQVSNQQLRTTWHGEGMFSCENIVFNSDGQILAIGGGITDGTVHFMRVSDARTQRTIDKVPGAVKSIAFSLDGKLLAIGTGQKTVQIWRINDWKLLHILWGHSSDVNGVGFNYDSQTLLSADYRETRLWNVSDGRFMNSIDDGPPLVMAPDGQRVALSKGIWRLADLTKIQEIGLNNEADLSADWQFIATADYTGKIKLRRIVGNQLISTLEYSKKRIVRIAYSPDGQTLAVCHDDAVLLWRL